MLTSAPLALIPGSLGFEASPPRPKPPTSSSAYGLNPSVALAMHHGTRGMCSMSSSCYGKMDGMGGRGGGWSSISPYSGNVMDWSCGSLPDYQMVLVHLEDYHLLGVECTFTLIQRWLMASYWPRSTKAATLIIIYSSVVQTPNHSLWLELSWENYVHV
jgi:hypothetical protein